jgi:hypothetical protein
VTAPGGGEFRRLSALIARQRHDLDRMQAEAASRSVVDLARGMLMAQLGCSPAQAQEQLLRLSEDSNTSVPDLAAQIAGQAPSGQERAGPLPSAAAAGDGAAGTGHDQAEDEQAAGLARAAAAAEFGQDGDEVAAALLEEALAPVGAVAVALWLAEPDGGLELAGEAGFGPREAGRWRRIHPDMQTAAQRAARSGLDSWWPAGRPAGEPAIGRWPQGARAVLPLPGAAPALGAIEICWPEAMAEFSDSLRRLLVSLADVSAQALGARAGRGGFAADRRASPSWTACPAPRCSLTPSPAIAESWPTCRSATSATSSATRRAAPPRNWPGARCWRCTRRPRCPAACSTSPPRCWPAASRRPSPGR